MTKARMEEIIEAYGCKATYSIPKRQPDGSYSPQSVGIYREEAWMRDLGNLRDMLEMSEEDLESKVRDASVELAHRIVMLTRPHTEEPEYGTGYRGPRRDAKLPTPHTGIRRIIPRPAPVIQDWEEGGEGA